MTKKHTHRAIHETEPLPFRYCVNSDDPNPVAHGGHRTQELCSCGMVREINHNAGQTEVGEWRDPDGIEMEAE